VSHPISAARAAWLLIRLRLRRQLNQAGSILRYRIGSPERKAASRSSPTMWLVSAFVAVAMLGGATQLAYRGIANIETVLGPVQAGPVGPAGDARARTIQQPRPSPRLAPGAPGTVVPRGVLQGVSLAAALLLIMALLVAVAGRDIARPEWDLEWLVTLPLPLSTLLVSKLIERTFTNVAGFLTLGPFLSVFAWWCGYRWTAPLLGFGLALALLLLVATAQLLLDTGLRLVLSPPKLRNLQATISIVGIFPIFLVMSMAMPGTSFVFGWAAALPDSAKWLPTGLAAWTIASSGIGPAVLRSTLMVAEILVAVGIGLALLRWLLRGGVIAAGAREAVARAPYQRRQPKSIAASARPSWLSAVQRRELRLLARDRTFMVQTLVTPAVIIGTQFFLFMGFGASFNLFINAMDQPSNLAAIAFGLAAYTLMFSCFQTLNTEGQALWMLYCVPHSLASVLWQKAKLWASVAAIYPAILFAIAIVLAGGVSLRFVGSAAIALLGIPILAVIATALGVFGCNPLEQDIQRRLRATYMYLYAILAAFYAYAIYASTIWQRGAVVILTALVAIALWQKTRDQFDYLLDPSAAPPSRVSVSDGLIAALMFFVLQAIVGLVLSLARIPAAAALWIAFCIAGALTYGAVRLIYWRAHTTGIPRLLRHGMPGALRWGMIGGIAAALAGFIYIQLVWSMDLFPALRRSELLGDHSIPLWVGGLAILAAPVFEEFIFRGLIFGGLRRSLSLGTATLASAAIFAIVHPPISVIPVFVMGICAALVYERTRMLAAPVLLHSIYNAAVLAFQWTLVR
jgi:ABC-2 type transport system permease protein